MRTCQDFNTNMCTCRCLHAHARTHTHTHTHTHKHTHICTHTHMHTHTHAHTYAQAHSHSHSHRTCNCIHICTIIGIQIKYDMALLLNITQYIFWILMRCMAVNDRTNDTGHNVCIYTYIYILFCRGRCRLFCRETRTHSYIHMYVYTCKHAL